MIRPPFPYRLRPMRAADIPRVLSIENQAFATPWPASAYREQLREDGRSRCFVLERVTGELLGYGCLWFGVDEAHLSTLAVARPLRGRGLGELLLIALIDEAIARGVVLVTLEVRVSNRAAQALYAKCGLEVVGRRKRYYADNHEDALIMTVEPLDAAYRARLARQQIDLFTRLEGGLAPAGIPDRARVRRKTEGV